jgi:hypothetical protein
MADKNAQTQDIIKRIVDLVEVYRDPTIEEYLDEMFQNHLQVTGESGQSLANGFYLLTHIKQIFKEAEQLTKVRVS